MPKLTWPGKTLNTISPSEVSLYSHVFPGGNGYPSAVPASDLYLGDNLEIMQSLLPAYAEKIDLIYVDPPFFTNKKFKARIGRGEDSRIPSEWKLDKGYSDHWNDLDEYLQFLYERLTMMHKLLSPEGSLYLHLDWHADAYARILLDEIFGANHLVNQIAWLYHGPSPIRNAFNRKHDTIFLYSKSDKYTFNCDDVREPYNPSTYKTFASSKKAGFGKIPDLKRGKVPEDWWYFPVVARLHNERTGYPTQKPEALLERIIKASSNEGDLVADFFCGSGTTPIVAGKLKRRFLAVDSSWRAFNTTSNRLAHESLQPFTTWMDDRYEFPKESGKLTASLENSKLSIECALELESWEIDPDWNGVQFNSVHQVKRPARKGEISRTVQITDVGKKVKIKALAATGELMEYVI